MNIYLDIETIPAQDPEAIKMLRKEADEEKRLIKAPSNYKDVAKIDEYIAAKKIEIDAAFDERYRKTSFDGALGQIACISYAIDDNTPHSIWSVDWKDSETDILNIFYDQLEAEYNPNSQTRPVFIGHNILNFDLRFIFQRSVMLGIKPPIIIPFKAKPWDDVVFDTMTAWAGVGNRVSLAKLCDVFKLDSKGSEIGEEIDGSKVWDFVQAGRIHDVAKYCSGDVERTRQIYKRLNFIK
jgi:predicted PolB exonuclease-like 3'-5' exonuclease